MYIGILFNEDFNFEQNLKTTLVTNRPTVISHKFQIMEMGLPFLVYRFHDEHAFPKKQTVVKYRHFSDASLPINSSTDGKVSIENATYQGRLLPSVSVNSPNQQGDQSEWCFFRRVY